VRLSIYSVLIPQVQYSCYSNMSYQSCGKLDAVIDDIAENYLSMIAAANFA
jgi:hypothetical protein